jgi:hypothetical protein
MFIENYICDGRELIKKTIYDSLAQLKRNNNHSNSIGRDYE